MSTSRLVLFCAEPDLDLGRLREAFDEVAQAHDLEPPGDALCTAETPASARAAGWAAVSLEGRPQLAGDHLVELTRAAARALDGRVVSVLAAERAKACVHGRAGVPRSTDGEPFHVVRAAAAWLEADPDDLGRFFATAAPAASVTGPADLSAVAEEPDEDDRYVESKLRAARELMQRYRSRV